MDYKTLNEPPKGWLAQDGLLHPDPTVAGYLARGQEIKGVCHLRDCRRRCHIDVERLARRGFGALMLTAAESFLKCQNLTGCALEFHAEPKTSLILRSVSGRSNVKIRIRCAGCSFFRVSAPEKVIAKLSVEKPLPDGFLVSEIAGRVRGPCKQCKASAWRVDVLWSNPKSEGFRSGAG